MTDAVRKPLLSLATLAVVLGGLEASLRIAGYGEGAPGGRSSTSEESRESFLRIADDEDVAYELTPGARGRGWECDVRVSSLGLRDREYSLEKPPGTYRIVVVGDSVAFGHGVSLERCFTERLEESVGSLGIEVLNLGVGGYDTIHEAAVLESRGVALQPDLALVAYCINDVRVWSPNLRHVRRLSEPDAPRGLRLVELVRDRLESARDQRADDEPRFRAMYAHRIAEIPPDAEVRSLMRSLGERLAARDEPMRSGAGRFFEYYASEAHVGRLRFGFEWLARTGAAHGFPVILAALPYHAADASPTERELVDRIVEHEARRAGLEHLAIDPDRDWEPLLTQVGIHPNARGHRAIARALEEALAGREDWPGKND